MNEQSLILIKPSFTMATVIIEVQKALIKAELETCSYGFANFSKEDAKVFYQNKKDEKYFDELTDYMSSGKVYGFVVKGDDAIRRTKTVANLLRDSLPKAKNLKTDVMRNIVHASCLDDGIENVKNEIKIFLKNKR